MDHRREDEICTMSTYVLEYCNVSHTSKVKKKSTIVDSDCQREVLNVLSEMKLTHLALALRSYSQFCKNIHDGICPFHLSSWIMLQTC